MSEVLPFSWVITYNLVGLISIILLGFIYVYTIKKPPGEKVLGIQFFGNCGILQECRLHWISWYLTAYEFGFAILLGLWWLSVWDYSGLKTYIFQKSSGFYVVTSLSTCCWHPSLLACQSKLSWLSKVSGWRKFRTRKFFNVLGWSLFSMHVLFPDQMLPYKWLQRWVKFLTSRSCTKIDTFRDQEIVTLWRTSCSKN